MKIEVVYLYPYQKKLYTHLKNYFIFLVVITLFTTCKKDFTGDAKMQSLPETYMVVDKISRSGDLRLSTTIEAHWWGVSQTGLIKGYEVSIDNQLTWQFTKNQNGTFLLTIPVGKDTADIAVYVRAVDNLDQKDPTPASTLYPVKNTPPTIYIDNSNGRKSISFPAFRYYWIANDTDGVADIQGVEIAFNDTNNIYSLPANTTAATFESQINSGVFSNKFFVYPNSKTIHQTDLINGIIYDQYNKFWVRVYDRSGSRSKWSKDSIFIKKPKSDIVLFNDYTGSKNYYQNFYANKLIALGAPYNNYDIVTSPIDEMPNDNFTSIKVFNFFKKIIWFSNNANATLSLASQNTTSFFNNGGKMLMIVDIGGSFAYNESQVSFTPIASFVSPPTVNDQFKMNPGDTATAVQSGWPNLITSSGILSTSIRPFFLQNTSANFAYSNLYNGKLVIPASPAPITWTGQSALIARRKDIATGATNLIFSAIPFDLLQGNSNIDTVFRKIIIEELKF